MATMTLDDLVSQLRKAYGADLRAVVLYGSSASGERTRKQSGHDVLVVVDRLDMATLRAEAAAARAWSGAGNPPPLTFTADEWRASADIFPMEYADILERHQVLHGQLPLDGVRVDPAHLRLQLEFEAMGKLLKLRRGILEAGGEPKRLVELLEVSLSTMLTILRAVLHLEGESAAADHDTICRLVAQRTGLDTAPFVRVVRHVRGEQKLSGADAEQVLEGYLSALTRLVAYLDRWTARA